MQTMTDADMLRQQVAEKHATIEELRREISRQEELILRQVDQLEEAERDADLLRQRIRVSDNRVLVLQNRIARIDDALDVLIEEVR